MDVFICRCDRLTVLMWLSCSWSVLRTSAQMLLGEFRWQHPPLRFSAEQSAWTWLRGCEAKHHQFVYRQRVPGDFPAAGIHAGVYCAQPYTSVEMLTSVEKNIFERWVKGCWCLEFPCYILLGAYVLRNQFSGWWNNTHLNFQIVFFFNCSCSLLFYNEIKLVKNWNMQDTESRVGVNHVLWCLDGRHLWENINLPNVPSNNWEGWNVKR